MEGITTDLVTAVSNQGFAIAVAVYSLTRLEKSIKSNTEVLIKLAERLDLK